MDLQKYQSGLKGFFKKFLFLLLIFFTSAFFVKCYALPFSIVPNGTLPTSVPLDSSVTASYLVSNNTGEQRNNNVVQYLPPNTSITAGGCGSIFNLAPSGQAGDSCILNLLITGPISSTDPNPHNHLFVCFPGGMSCAGTPYPLNVTQAGPILVSFTITPGSASVPAGLTQQFTATGTYTDGSTQNITSAVSWSSSNTAAATINSAGLATGVSVGTTNISASLGSINSSNQPLLTVTAAILNSIAVTPTSANLVVGGTQQYTATGTYSDNSTQTITGSVTWNSSTTAVATIISGGTNAGQATGISLGSTNISATSGSINSNTAALLVTQFAYVTNTNTDSVSACVLNSDGSFGACTATGSGFSSPSGITLNSAKSFAYITNNGSNNLSYCSITSNGLFGSCNTTTGGYSYFSNPLGISLNASGSQIYIANSSGNNIVLCSITGGSINTCGDSGGTGFASPSGIALNSANSFAYVSNSGNNTVYYCIVSNSDGTLSGCRNTGGIDFSDPLGLGLNPSNSMAYTVNNTNSTVSYCTITGGGESLGCNIAEDPSFVGPSGIAINASNTFAYIANTSNNTISYCPVNSDGSFAACSTTGTGFNGPTGIVGP